MFRSSNPAFRNDVFTKPQTWDSFHGSAAAHAHSAAAPTVAVSSARAPGAMTISGTVNKSFFLLALCITTAVCGWQLTAPESGGLAGVQLDPRLVTLGGGIGGLIMVLIGAFKPKASVVVAPLYALFEGFFVGGVSAIYAVMYGNMKNPGTFVPDATILIQASMGTFGVFGAMLAAYKFKLIKPTGKFRSMVIAGTGGLCLLYLGTYLLRLFGVEIPMLHQAGWVTLGICGVAIFLASMNLILDFDFIAQGARNGTPAWGEWYGSMGLLVTLVWLYVELLRLIYIVKSMVSER